MTGPYQIEAEIGRGQLGCVYRAVHPATNCHVALKVVPLQEFTDPRVREAQRQRILGQARAASVLLHPAIAAVYEVGIDGESLWVAMEYVRGSSLARLLAAQPRPRRHYVFAILGPVAAALDYAHKRGAIHQDIKPSNIMIGEGGVPKIVDFGVARIVPPTATHSYFRVGTPAYAALEQIQGKRVDGRADQYSLAVVAYEMLSGETPTQVGILNAVGYSMVNTLGNTIGYALTRALSASPEMRFPTCTAFVSALEGR